MISGLESLDADAAAVDADVVDDEVAGSSDETDVADPSSVTVAFHCYHSLPSAKWSDNLQVRNSHILLLLLHYIRLMAFFPGQPG